MHEYALVQDLVGQVESLARRRGAAAVHRVVVSIGELSGVDPELFRTAYDTFRAGTICAPAPLELRAVAARWSCPASAPETPRGAILTCPGCALPARLAPGGDELRLETIEMEVP